jgi:carbamoyltransferase
MSYNILGINPFHNGSACVLSDGEVIYFLEEERLTRKKHDANPFRVILDVLNRFKIDEVVIAGINVNDVKLAYNFEDPFYSLIRKFYPELKFFSLSHQHHLTHLYHTYFNSGFSKSLGVVMDNSGSFYNLKGSEINTIYDLSSSKAKVLTKDFNIYLNLTDHVSLNAPSAYSCITQHLGFKLNEEGKVMGLSSYGKPNKSFPPFFLPNYLTNPKILFGTLYENKEELLEGIKKYT